MRNDPWMATVRAPVGAVPAKRGTPGDPARIRLSDRPAGLLAGLQRRAGNRAVARYLNSSMSLAHRQGGRSTERTTSRAVQRVIYPSMNAMWAAVHPGFHQAIVAADPELSVLYQDAANQLPHCDFVPVPGTAPQITALAPGSPTPFRVDWDTAANLQLDDAYFVGAVIHELAHAGASQLYARRGINTPEFVWGNMHLPVAAGVVDPNTGMTPNQLASFNQQQTTIRENWDDLDHELDEDHSHRLLPNGDYNHIRVRIAYASHTASVHNDTVLADILYYLRAKHLEHLETYSFAQRMLHEANQRRQAAGVGAAVGRITRRPWYLTMWGRLPKPFIGVM